jgi:hypothetical protein
MPASHRAERGGRLPWVLDLDQAVDVAARHQAVNLLVDGIDLFAQLGKRAARRWLGHLSNPLTQAAPAFRVGNLFCPWWQMAQTAPSIRSTVGF